MSPVMEKPQAQTVRHLLQSTNCYLVVRKQQFGAMGIHIPYKMGSQGATVIDYEEILKQFGFVSLARSKEM